MAPPGRNTAAPTNSPTYPQRRCPLFEPAREFRIVDQRLLERGLESKRQATSTSQSQLTVVLSSIRSRPARSPRHPSDQLLRFAVDRFFLISRCTRGAH